VGVGFNGSAKRSAWGDLRSVLRRGQETCAERALCAWHPTPYTG
jgi:hypothetical protein